MQRNVVRLDMRASGDLSRARYITNFCNPPPRDRFQADLSRMMVSCWHPFAKMPPEAKFKPLAVSLAMPAT